MAERRAGRPPFVIRVLNINGKPLENAVVRVDHGPSLEYSPIRRGYALEELTAGVHHVLVEAPNLESQERSVTRTERIKEERFVLGAPGLPYYYRGRVKVPYDLEPMVAVALRLNVKRLPDDLAALATDLGLESAPVPRHAAGQQVHVFRAPRDQPGRAKLFEEKSASTVMRDRFVHRTGHVVCYGEEYLSFLTDECVVKFHPAIDALAEAQRRQLAVLRQLPYSENTFVLQASPSMISLDLLDICNGWAASGEAIWAEPNLVSTTVPHAPNDKLLGPQLHHAIIDSQGAWDIVQGAQAAGEITDVVLAVNDYGCLTTHEDLAPILTSQFSFSTNTTALLEHPHGTSTCGIAAAELDNGKGVAGIAGFPAFVDLIAVQIPNSIPAGTEQDFAAMLLWCAGLPNGRAVPAALARGADVISNSWGQHGIALSGDITAAFDALADTGRNDLGCVVVFSAGNHDDFFDDHFPWAAHPAVIAVSASTVTLPERKVSSSNFGQGIEVCAPGGENSAVASGSESTFSTTTSRTFDPLGDYGYFGETSAACPMVAGVAALMLAVNPELEAREIRELLRTTAAKIDGGNKDPIGQYDNGYSGWYGYGRINARAAVQAAQAARAGAAHVPAAPTNVRITN